MGKLLVYSKLSKISLIALGKILPEFQIFSYIHIITFVHVRWTMNQSFIERNPYKIIINNRQIRDKNLGTTPYHILQGLGQLSRFQSRGYAEVKKGTE